jgi:DNA-binding Xre family transcriptional regulator
MENRKISYNKLWKLLIDKKITKADLRKAVKMSPNTMTKMTKDEEVSMGIIIKIANYLDCDISDMMELVKKEV